MTFGGAVIFGLFCCLVGYGWASHAESKEARSLYHQLQNAYRKIEALERHLREARERGKRSMAKWRGRKP